MLSGGKLSARAAARLKRAAKEGVRGKIDWWVNAMEVHSFDATTVCCHDRFRRSVRRRCDRQRVKAAEKNVRGRRYTVKNENRAGGISPARLT